MIHPTILLVSGLLMIQAPSEVPKPIPEATAPISLALPRAAEVETDEEEYPTPRPRVRRRSVRASATVESWLGVDGKVMPVPPAPPMVATTLPMVRPEQAPRPVTEVPVPSIIPAPAHRPVPSAIGPQADLGLKVVPPPAPAPPVMPAFVQPAPVVPKVGEPGKLISTSSVNTNELIAQCKQAGVTEEVRKSFRDTAGFEPIGVNLVTINPAFAQALSHDTATEGLFPCLAKVGTAKGEINYLFEIKTIGDLVMLIGQVPEGQRK